MWIIRMDVACEQDEPMTVLLAVIAAVLLLMALAVFIALGAAWLVASLPDGGDSE